MVNDFVSDAAKAIIPLSFLAAGETAEVFAIAGQAEQARRLSELGFREGAAIEMVTPGSPCIVRLESSKFCVRATELSSILVRTSARSRNSA